MKMIYLGNYKFFLLNYLLKDLNPITEDKNENKTKINIVKIVIYILSLSNKNSIINNI